jgi:hypothetical protein
MRKRQELLDPQSCMNKANPNELVFVLLGRDAAAPAAIAAWAQERIRLEKNAPGDSQVTQALETARLMERERLGLDTAEPLTVWENSPGEQP